MFEAFLTRHRDRMVALALLAVAASLFFLLVVLPLAGMLAKPRAEVTRDVRLIAAYRATIASRPVLEQNVRELEARAASLPGLVSGDSSALAAAQIQNALKATIEGAGGNVHSSLNLPPKASGNYEDVPLIYSLAVPLDKIVDVLYAVETGQPALRLSDLHIQVPESLSATAAPPPGTLAEIQWTVTGTRWAGTK